MSAYRVPVLAGLAAATLTLTTACADMASNERIPVETLYSGSNCGGDQEGPRLRVITDHEQFQAERDAMFRHVVGGDHADRLAAPDFNDTIAVLVTMGQRPTGGYRLALREPRAAIDNGTVELPITWQEPDEDAMVTQAITSPCLMVTLPRQDYDTISAVDQDGETRARE